MLKLRKTIIQTGLLSACLSTMLINTAHASILSTNSVEQNQVQLEQQLLNNNPALNQSALVAGIRAYDHLQLDGKDHQQVLTIVNFDKPSNEKRLWVINMKTGKVKYHTYVAQGQNTGLNVAKHFSNVPGTHESSIGVYLTGHTYYGRDGHSMRLHGLDKGFNSNVFRRHIVMHPAWYVSKSFAEKYGRIGRTYGCFGLNKFMAPKVINTIKNGTVMVAYYPNQNWLASSPYEKPFTADLHFM